MKDYTLQMGRPGRNGQIPRNVQKRKTEVGKNRKCEQTHN